MTLNRTDNQYSTILRDLMQKGNYRTGRNGGVFSLFGAQMRFNLADGFPLLTTKKVFFKGIVAELLWFMHGDTNIKFLHDHGVHIWDEWADKNGDLGPVYGKQWRSWSCGYEGYSDVMANKQPRTIDQLGNVIESLKRDPYGRRHMVSAWNPAEIEDMALPPCHCLFQFYVADGKLSCQLYQRSADWFLGVPFNIASYALLTHLIAKEVGLEVGEFIHSFGDFHLYENHLEQALEQLRRTPRLLPRLEIVDKPVFELDVADIQVVDYDPHPAISAPVSA